MIEAPRGAFFAELKRRKVVRVAVAYVAAAFVVIQAADVVFPRIPLPDWTVSLVVWLALLGLPIALVLAWAFDITPAGVQRTTAPTDEHDPAHAADRAPGAWHAGFVRARGRHRRARHSADRCDCVSAEHS